MSNKRAGKSLFLSKVVLVLPALFVFLTSLAFFNPNSARAANDNPWRWSDDYSTLTLTGYFDADAWNQLSSDIQTHEDTITAAYADEGTTSDAAMESSVRSGGVFGDLPYLKTIDFSKARFSSNREEGYSIGQLCLGDVNLESFTFSQYPIGGTVPYVMAPSMFANCSNLKEVNMGPAVPHPYGEYGEVATYMMFVEHSEGGVPSSIENITAITLDSSFILTPGDAATGTGSFFDYKEPGAWYAYQNNKLQATLVGFDEFRAYQETHPGVSTYYYGEDPGPEPIPEHTGWVWEDAGWRYYTEDGSYLNDDWEWIEDDVYGAHWYYFYSDGFCAMRDWIWDGAWYYIQGDCTMAYGTWSWLDGAWYGFNWDGTMCVGWIWDNDYRGWYYCYSNGIMARNTLVDSYYVDDSGRWIR